MATKIPGFRSEPGRHRFLAAYDAAFDALWSEPRQEQDVETTYGTVHVHRVGTTQGATPFVLLHGSGANAAQWYPQVGPLSAGRQVIAVDVLDDPGRSIATRGGMTDDDHAAWVDETLAGLGLDAVHLVGHSYGGWLALDVAIRRPRRLASVTLLDPGGLERVRPKFFVTVLGGVVALALPAAARPWAAHVLANHALIEPPELVAPVMLGSRLYRPDRSLARPFSDDELRQVRTPVQVLIAGRSTMLHPRRAAARIQRLLPDARIEVVPDVGHGLPLEVPQLVNDRLLTFAEAVDATRHAACS